MRFGVSSVLIVVGAGLLATVSAQAVPFTLTISAGEVGQSVDELETVGHSALGCSDPTANTTVCDQTDLNYSNDDYVALTIEDIHLELDNDPQVLGNMTVTNAQPFAQQFTLLFNLPVVAMPDALTGGRASGTLRDTGGDPGANIAAPLGSALYTALIDSNNWQQLHAYPAAYTVTFPNPSAPIPNQFFGGPVPPTLQYGSPVNTSIGIRLDFILSGNDQVTFNTLFRADPVPEPTTGALMALGLAMLAKRRRH